MTLDELLEELEETQYDASMDREMQVAVMIDSLLDYINDDSVTGIAREIARIPV